MSRQAWRLSIGEQVADYRIERVLGRGGTASVYQGTKDGRSYAVKVMHAHDRSGVGRKRFEREAAFVQRLVHPNVVELFDFGFTDEGRPYIVFEELEGVSLKQALRRDGAFEPLRAVHIVMGVLDALDAAHVMGIIHRDIKPGNIFLAQEAGGERVKVLDFGLAKAFGPQPLDTTTLTKTGYRIGTPRYMSPEMARGRESEPASDLYSLGLVFAEMLAGEPVVGGDAQMQIILAHSDDDALPLPEQVQQSPFAPVLRKAIQKDLADRYAAALEMRRAVGAVVQRLFGERVRIAPSDEEETQQEIPDGDPFDGEGGGTIVMKDPGRSGRFGADLSVSGTGVYEEPTKDRTTAVIQLRHLEDETVTVQRRSPVADPHTDLTTLEYRRDRPLPAAPATAPGGLSHRTALVVGIVLAVMTFLLGMALFR